MIPYGRQTIDDEDIRSVVETLRSDWLTQGSKVGEFEDNIAKHCGASYAVVFSSGTAALQGAYFAVGLGPGDEFLTSPLTFVATSNVGLWLGAKPVFVDVYTETGNIHPALIERNITSRTKAIMPVDFAGCPAQLDEIMAIAERRNLVVIEDACHALGASYKGKKVGSISDMTVFSFHPVKAITTGEGGAVVTNNRDFYEKLKIFRHHGINKEKVFPDLGPWCYDMEALGLNYRLTDFQCALGISQLKKLDGFIAIRRRIAQAYREAFSDWPEIELLPQEYHEESAHHLFVIRLRKEWASKRLEVFKKLRNNGIGVQVHYTPVYWHSYYRNLGYAQNLCPQAEDFYSRAISLPIFPSLESRQQKKVIHSLRLALDQHCRDRVSL